MKDDRTTKPDKKTEQNGADVRTGNPGAEPPPLPDEAQEKEFRQDIERLAKMSRLASYRVLPGVAEKWGMPQAEIKKDVKNAKAELAKNNEAEAMIRERGWDKAKPWGKQVDGGELLDKISDFIHRYVYLPDLHADAVAMWSVMTWLHDKLEISGWT